MGRLRKNWQSAGRLDRMGIVLQFCRLMIMTDVNAPADAEAAIGGRFAAGISGVALLMARGRHRGQ
jgi:hypothetical protein